MFSRNAVCGVLLSKNPNFYDPIPLQEIFKQATYANLMQ